MKLPVCPGQGAGLPCSKLGLGTSLVLSVRDSAPADSRPSLNSRAVRRANLIAFLVPRAVPCLSLLLSCLPGMQFAHSLARTRSFLSSLPPAVSGRQVKVTVWHVCFCIIYVVEDRVRHLEDSLRSHVNPSKWDSIAQPAK